MKTLPSGMQTDLDSGATTHCHCWDIVRTDNVTMGFTDHDVDITFGGVTYKASTGLTASGLEQSQGLNVDNTQVVGFLNSTAITEGQIAAGLYDNAPVRMYVVNWRDVNKRLLVFRGTIGEVTRGKMEFKGEVRSVAHFLSQPGGRQYSRLCDADLGDSRCNASIASSPKTVNTTVSAVPSTASFRTTDATIAAQADNYYMRGAALFTSGPNAGQRFEIRSAVRGSGYTEIVLWEGPASPITVGVSVTVYVGCDKSAETCYSKFNNITNFRGFPRIPGNDVLAATAKQTGFNDGGSLFR